MIHLEYPSRLAGLKLKSRHRSRKKSRDKSCKRDVEESIKIESRLKFIK